VVDIIADNKAIDNGSLTDYTAASDEIGGVDYFYVKLADGTDGSTAKIGGDATNGLDVDVTRIIPGVTASALGKAEDDVFASGDTGVMALAIRQDTAAATAANGDYVPLSVDASGRLYVNVGSIPAAAMTTDNIGAVAVTNAVMNGLTQLVPKFAKANVTAGSTDTSIVAAVALKQIRVLSFRLHVAGTATNVTFNTKPGGAGTAISELFACGVNGGRAEAFSPVGHFQPTAGEGLTVTTGAGSTVGVGVVYVEV
jgi:hypothetical protein